MLRLGIGSFVAIDEVHGAAVNDGGQFPARESLRLFLEVANESLNYFRQRNLAVAERRLLIDQRRREDRI